MGIHQPLISALHCVPLLPSPEMHSMSNANLTVHPTVPVSSGVSAVEFLASAVFGASRLSPPSHLAEPHGGMGQAPGQGSTAAAAMPAWHCHCGDSVNSIL